MKPDTELYGPGPCAKVQVTCTLTFSDGARFTGRNDCDAPQQTCPRLPGEGYEKCKTICKQLGHAEQVAADLAEAAGKNLAGARALIVGHTYACRECQERLFSAGVISIRCVKDFIEIVKGEQRA